MSRHNYTPKAFLLKQSSCEITNLLGVLQYVYGSLLGNRVVGHGFISPDNSNRRMLICEIGGVSYG